MGYSSDRRRHVRIIVRALIDVSCREFSSSEKATYEGFIHSISKGGVSFRTRKPLPNVSYIEFEMLITMFNKKIRPRVKILWRNEEKNLYGGEIIEIRPDEQKVLENYIEYPLATKKISMDRRMHDNPDAFPGGKDRRHKKP